MTRSRIFLAVFVALLLAATLGAGVWLGRHGPLQRTLQPAAAHAAGAPDAPGIVTVSTDAQSRSGIATQAVEPAAFHPSVSAFATVVDLEPLLALRARIAAGQAGVGSARAQASASRQELERNRALYADDRNVSRKAVQQAEAADHGSQARLESAKAELRAARAAAAQQYGPKLAAWAAQPSSPEIDGLASRRHVLVAVALPHNFHGATPDTVHLAAPGYEGTMAKLVSASPRSDPLAPGRTYLYLSDAPYPTGLAIDARIPLGGPPIEGFVVPRSAVIWYGNEAWVFVQQAADRFVRRALHEPRSVPHGIFTTTAFARGERVVTTGAELLQSEDLRPKTPAGAGCSDPECD